MLTQIKSGFQPSFWVANGMELFERLAYYGQATILSVFLRDHLRFDEVGIRTINLTVVDSSGRPVAGKSAQA